MSKFCQELQIEGGAFDFTDSVAAEALQLPGDGGNDAEIQRRFFRPGMAARFPAIRRSALRVEVTRARVAICS